MHHIKCLHKNVWVERRISNHKIIPHINKHRWQYWILTRLFKRKKCSLWKISLIFIIFHYLLLILYLTTTKHRCVETISNDFLITILLTFIPWDLRFCVFIRVSMNIIVVINTQNCWRNRKKININKEFIGFWMTWSLWHYLFIPSTFFFLFYVVDVCFSRFSRCCITAKLDFSIYLTFFAIYNWVFDWHSLNISSDSCFVSFFALGCWLN